MMKIDTRGRWLTVTALVYIYIPVLLFLWGFTKWYIAFISSVAVIWGVYLLLSDIIKNHTTGEKDEPIYLSLPMFVLAAVVITGLCMVLGVGGFFPQAGDWYKHNAVLSDLINFSWPVYYDDFGRCMLTYYLGQYLIPAVIGKLFGGFSTGSIAMFVTSVLGLWLIYIMLVKITRADNVIKQVALLLIMLLFCGPLNLTQSVLTQVCGDKFYSMGSYHWVLMDNILLQYRSNTIMIRWILPQIVVPWLTVIMLLEYRKKVNFYVILLLPTLLFGSFSFAALAVLGIMEAIYLLIGREAKITDVFSLTNILPALSFGSVLFMYFLGNMQVDKPVSSSFRFQIYGPDELPLYIVFCLLMFGVYFACCYSVNKSDEQWYFNLLILLLLPWTKMGLCNDVVMSGSIPSLFILMIMICRTLFTQKESTALGIAKGIMIVFLLIGCIYPVKEIGDNIRDNRPGMETADYYATMRWFTDRSDTNISEDLVYNYYTYDPEGKIFYEYIARKK